MNNRPYEKWIWIELIGFDHTESDFGVKAYLDNIGFIPQGISLLMFSPDFVHAHEGMERENVLPMEVCSYGARPYGKERNRQAWTNYQLRGLVVELQKHGIEIYCSFFNLFHFHVEGEDSLRQSKWCAAHPELYEMRKRGEALPVINPLRRFKDGSYYEDLLIHDLMIILQDYNFDGYHGADGYTSPRLSLAEGDYSDDMVDQFIHYSEVELGNGVALVCDGDPIAMVQRGEWIWHNKRTEWIHFYAHRWGEQWKKMMSALHKMGKKGVVNSAWTRDPFEALYRYGVDYKLLAAAGVDGIVVESVGATCSSGVDDMEYDPGSEFMAMLMAIKAYVPDTKLIGLNSIQDTNEQYDALSHVPTLVERDIYSFSNIYLQDQDGVKRCTSGFVACLGDGISKDGWEWLIKRWDLGYEGLAKRVIGASFVWSDEVLHRSLVDYTETRNWPVHKFVTELIERGAPIQCVVNVNELQNGTIFVANVHLLPEQELQQVLTYRNGSSVLVGRMTERISQERESIGLNGECELNQFFCVVRDENGTVLSMFVEETDANRLSDTQNDLSKVNDSLSWINSLYFNSVSDSFLNGCIRVLVDAAGSPKVTKHAEHIRTTVLEMEGGIWRILIRNLHVNYKRAHIDVGRPIASMSILTDFPGIPIKPKDSNFNLIVPGRGMVMVEISFK
ncbi:hypothetical protein Back11_18600 [Paenibacillus baekrokdamisoli]|uniref:Uncharacterized protein n=1 Tax=Paenibacillus baekrokdamisoli TaxID=1712516 RepID=A0A3G9IWJ0_9BACL|nr:hypothetical protein [Paenibacillus baekrokdamisoli]MBB3072457.1 hypothetical protein [Paenibacillus baekrokdamisoli]BBH20515.1 hypothetical protein Back11_18600 [Paenibacillus baekrokdamisoli]